MDKIVEDILDFWFAERAQKHWFNSTAAFDNEIREHFLTLHIQASKGALDHWAQTAPGTLALIIVLDQFTRNLFRGTAEAFSNDVEARRIAQKAINNNYQESLDGQKEAFLYMPFMHSENLEDQELSVQLFMRAGLDNARYAIEHRDIIRRFGRFPHRNKILGRQSTPEEIQYLIRDDAFRG